MKQPKPLTRNQKEAIARTGKDWSLYGFYKMLDENTMLLYNKKTQKKEEVPLKGGKHK